MNKMIKLAAVAAATASVALGAGTANAATASATATAEILQQVAVTKTADLSFGSLVPSTSASASVTVAANAAGTRNCGGLTCSGTSASAAFTVTGASGLAVTVSGLSGLTALTGPGANMPISLSGSTLDMSSGSDTLYVGGNLTVGANQAAGSYTGNFTVQVDYQ